ncbi:MAG: gamma-glutamyltransferase [Acidocella sp.]|nr:gamma-glutamyltransferase [Acidocella sp.]
MALHKHPVHRLALLATLAALAGCGVTKHLPGFGGDDSTTLGQADIAPSVFGYVVADEPQAALAARQILNNGGNAADAAAAAGFAMAVTLPSRAGLGGGGACILKMPAADGGAQPPVTLLFPAGAPAGSGGDRPAAVPSLARGLLALQARYGTLPFASVIAPAERLAGGSPVSPALAADLQIVGGALLADPVAASIFGAPGGGVLSAGANLVQPDLETTLESLRTQGIDGFYSGSLSRQFIEGADQAGANLAASDLTTGLPVFGQPAITKFDGNTIAFIPNPPNDGNLPASAGFEVLDKNGGVVACATSMNNLFGTGRVAAGTGVLLAASPRAVTPPLLTAGIAYKGDEFHAAVTGTGQVGATDAVFDGLANALHKTPAAEVPDPSRVNVISCPGGMPGGESSCLAYADPRGQGLATGGH